MGSFVTAVLGVVVGILTLGQGLAILTFGLPTARQWLREGRLTDARPLERYHKTLAVLTGILAVSGVGVWFVFPRGILAFVVGLGIGIIGALGGLQKKDDLLADFLQSNASSISPVAVEGPRGSAPAQLSQSQSRFLKEAEALLNLPLYREQAKLHPQEKYWAVQVKRREELLARLQAPPGPPSRSLRPAVPG